jgi:transposase-like protein
MSKRKRRKFSAEFKAEIVLAVLTGEKSQAAICRDHELSAQQFSNWKQQFLENAGRAFEQATSNENSEQIAELERMVGRLTMQLEIAKKASSILTSASTSNGKWS